MSARSGAGFAPAGAAAPASRVQGKFSIQFACVPDGSISWTLAQVFGAFHQLWNLSDRLGRPAMSSCASALTGMLPPCPLTISTRRKPARWTEATRSRTTASSVSTCSEIVPGKARK